jgi:hypothetical protein
LPFRFVDGDAVEAFDVGICEREGRGKRDAHRHCLFVDSVGGCDFSRAWGYFDGEGGVGLGGLLRVGPRGYGLESGGYYGWRDLDDVNKFHEGGLDSSKNLHVSLSTAQG